MGREKLGESRREEQAGKNETLTGRFLEPRQQDRRGLPVVMFHLGPDSGYFLLPGAPCQVEKRQEDDMSRMLQQESGQQKVTQEHTSEIVWEEEDLTGGWRRPLCTPHLVHHIALDGNEDPIPAFQDLGVAQPAI